MAVPLPAFYVPLPAGCLLECISDDGTVSKCGAALVAGNSFCIPHAGADLSTETYSRAKVRLLLTVGRHVYALGKPAGRPDACLLGKNCPNWNKTAAEYALIAKKNCHGCTHLACTDFTIAGQSGKFTCGEGWTVSTLEPSVWHCKVCSGRDLGHLRMVWCHPTSLAQLQSQDELVALQKEVAAAQLKAASRPQEVATSKPPFVLRGRGLWFMNSTCITEPETARLSLVAGEHIYRDNIAPDTLAAAVKAKLPKMLKAPHQSAHAFSSFTKELQWFTTFQDRPEWRLHHAIAADIVYYLSILIAHLHLLSASDSWEFAWSYGLVFQEKCMADQTRVTYDPTVVDAAMRAKVQSKQVQKTLDEAVARSEAALEVLKTATAAAMRASTVGAGGKAVAMGVPFAPGSTPTPSATPSASGDHKSKKRAKCVTCKQWGYLPCETCAATDIFLAAELQESQKKRARRNIDEVD